MNASASDRDDDDDVFCVNCIKNIFNSLSTLSYCLRTAAKTSFFTSFFRLPNLTAVCSTFLLLGCEYLCVHILCEDSGAAAFFRPNTTQSGQRKANK